MDWDDLKIFLAVARVGSVRKAAQELKVNQSTVSRRITAFEKNIDATLFEKQPTGYLITKAGKEILANVERIEAEVSSIDRHLFQRQPQINGTLKVALPVPLATSMLMPDIAAFCESHPEIQLDLVISSGNTNLSKREADVAIRIVKVGDTPPPYLVGRKVGTYATAAYVAKSRLNKENQWIGSNSQEPPPAWLENSELADFKMSHTIDELVSLIAATKAGLGMAILPCCLADIEENLVRLPTGVTEIGREIWLLTHIDLKNTPRVRAFLDFLHPVFEDKKSLIEGTLFKFS